MDALILFGPNSLVSTLPFLIFQFCGDNFLFFFWIKLTLEFNVCWWGRGRGDSVGSNVSHWVLITIFYPNIEGRARLVSSRILNITAGFSFWLFLSYWLKSYEFKTRVFVCLTVFTVLFIYTLLIIITFYYVLVLLQLLVQVFLFSV